jgi:hypothetical protein
MTERTGALEDFVSEGPLEWGVFGAIMGALLLVVVT